MEVRLADCAGFCFGVKRAVDTVYEQLKTGRLSIPMAPSCIMRKWSGNWRKRSKSSGKQRRTKKPESRGDHSHCDHPCPWSGKRNL